MYKSRHNTSNVRRSSGGFSRNGRQQNFRGGGAKAGPDFSKFINKNIEDNANIKADDTMSKSLYSDLAITDGIKRNIASKGYNFMTPIQEKAIPVILEGKDLIGIANTGTGKTAAFLIPMIEKVLKNRDQSVIIMAPTRELAVQINAELITLTQGLGVYSVVCIGGQNIHVQKANLQRNHNFIICTPGRLRDLLDRRAVFLNKYNNVILDEVDRMFDMGFYKEIKVILDFLPRIRQTLFFSATVSKDIEVLILKYLNNPVKISVNQRNITSSVQQDIVRVNAGSTKIDTLHELLIQEEFKKVLIFGKTKRGVESLHFELRDRGFKVESIHGDKTQSSRQKSLFLFKENKVSILVATDVAARGLDIPNVTHVINYDKPATTDDYVHRIGRTGRGDKKGIALTFII